MSKYIRINNENPYQIPDRDPRSVNVKKCIDNCKSMKSQLPACHDETVEESDLQKLNVSNIDDILLESLKNPEIQERIIQQVAIALGSSVLGEVDSDKNIKLSDVLSQGTYTLSYEDVNGLQTKICTLLAGNISFTNQLAISTDKDGAVFNGVGYQTGCRIGSAGDISTLSNLDGATNPAFASGYIPCKSGDIIRMKNCYLDTIGSGDHTTDRKKYGHDINGLRIAAFNEYKELIFVEGMGNYGTSTTFQDYISFVVDSNGHVEELSIVHSDIAYFRTTLLGDPGTAIVTVNELIFDESNVEYDDIGTYDNFIVENIGTLGARRIGVYNSSGVRIGLIPIGSLLPPDTSDKLYSFGALADIHLTYDTSERDFIRALTYLNNTEDVAFTCIAGDLTSRGTANELQGYKDMVRTYSPNTPVYAVTGNHDGYNAEIESIIEKYTDKPLYYSFTQGDDVFIMCGIKSSGSGTLFTEAELQWLYETLEANRNRRCFVFHHVRPQDGCGNAFGIYNFDIWGGNDQLIFESLMTHYKNAHQFHGHSHLKFYLQYGSDIANIDHIFGGWSIHIPSLAVPRDGDVTGANSRQEIYADSEGYVVDVYKNGIHLRGRDFVQEKFLPIASYWLDTTLQTIDEKTYVDPTGTIVI